MNPKRSNMKRSHPTQENESSPSHLNFISACEDGWETSMQLDLRTVDDPKKMEEFFDYIMVTRRSENRKGDYFDGFYRPAEALMCWIQEAIIKGEDDPEDDDRVEYLSELKENLDKFIHDLPVSPEKKAKWGVWKMYSHDSLPVTFGKHYHYSSYVC